jgi:hypothetical protein
MVTAKDGDPDTGRISGFDADVSHVLFVVGGQYGIVRTYLVPREVAEAAFRKAHRDWLSDGHDDARDSTTWVIYFHDRGSPGANNYNKHWAKYQIEPPVPEPSGAASSKEREEALTIPEAKRRLARSLGVPVDSVKITIEA